MPSFETEVSHKFHISLVMNSSFLSLKSSKILKIVTLFSELVVEI